MVTRITIGADGEATSQEMPSVKQTTSSEDYQQGGVSYRDNHGTGFAQKTHEVSSLSDNAIVNLNGMELRVGDAKALGLMAEITAAAEAQGAPANPAPAKPEDSTEGPKAETTGSPSFDEARDALNEAIEAGNISFEEGAEFDVANGTLAMTNTTPEEAWDMLAKVGTGEASVQDLDPEAYGAAERAYAQTYAAASKSALGELGPTAGAELANLIRSHPGVNAAAHRYALDRSQGATNVTWNQLYEHIKSDLGMT